MITAYIVNAFTETPEGGNPAGIIMQPENLSENEMISIANQLGFSESVFVQKSDKADYKLRFFSPKEEVDLCGHATIATFHLLIEKGLINFGNLEKKVIIQETKAGILSVTCHKNGLVIMEQKKPEYLNIQNDRKEIATLLNLNENDILKKYPIQIISTGATKLIFPVSSLKKLFSIKPNFNGIINYCKRVGVRGFYPFTFETIESNSDFHTRQFNPLIGINEDPQTGVAAGALGAYVMKNNILQKDDFIIEQGYCMKKPGKIYVKIKENKILVGGKAVTIDKKRLEIK